MSSSYFSVVLMGVLLVGCGDVDFNGLNEAYKSARADQQEYSSEDSESDHQAANEATSSTFKVNDGKDSATPNNSGATGTSENLDAGSKPISEESNEAIGGVGLVSKCDQLWEEAPNLKELEIEDLAIDLKNANDQSIFSDRESDSKKLLKVISVDAWNMNNSSMELADPNSWYCIGVSAHIANGFKTFAKNPKRVAFWSWKSESGNEPDLIQRD